MPPTLVFRGCAVATADLMGWHAAFLTSRSQVRFSVDTRPSQNAKPVFGPQLASVARITMPVASGR
jgi:hypothetical protein